MSRSQLLNIYQVITDLEFLVRLNPEAEPVGVTALGLTDLPDTVDSWRGPCRLLLPIAANRANGQLAAFKTFGNSKSTIDWTLTDLLFLRPVSAGVGLASSALALVSYCADYVGMLGDLRTPAWSVTNMSFPIFGVFEWPEGSGKSYVGVATQLTIREIL